MRMRIALLMCGLAAAVAGSIAAAPVRAASTTRSCGVVKGAHWSMFKQSGTAYRVLAASAAECKTARAWVPRLTRLSGARLMRSGPPGYRCGPGTGLKSGWIGGCLEHAKFAFSWGPSTRR
jgi:hypothetical protein